MFGRSPRRMQKGPGCTRFRSSRSRCVRVSFVMRMGIVIFYIMKRGFDLYRNLWELAISMGYSPQYDAFLLLLTYSISSNSSYLGYRFFSNGMVQRKHEFLEVFGGRKHFFTSRPGEFAIPTVSYRTQKIYLIFWQTISSSFICVQHQAHEQ